MDTRRLTEIEERCEKATPGKWVRGSVMWSRTNDGKTDDWPWGARLPLGKCGWCVCAAHCTSTLIKVETRDGHVEHLHHITQNDTSAEDWHGISSVETGDEITGNYDYEEGGVSSKKEDSDFIAHARTDLPDLLAYCKSLRAEAAELARTVIELREAHRVHLSLSGQLPHPTDGLYANTGRILSRPTVVELLKEKD